ncbi:glyoxalase [Plantactinospora sp. GCM10030261]|uniref:glyoxalase n=1 Tax=Plantactinospora sp. GCM10030261 TaxID=3273420 RepID=UPI00361F59BA
MTTTITSVVLQVEDVDAGSAFYTALGLSDRVQLTGGSSPTSGFRGYTLSLVTAGTAQVDAYVRAATEAGADLVKEPSKSLWGYGGTFCAPDGAVWTVASSSKKDRGQAELSYDDLVLLLGVKDVKEAKRFYAEQGLRVAKGFGGKYVEFETAGIKVALQPRHAVAKNAGVSDDGSGSHRLTVIGDAGSFTDPDGFSWEERSVGAQG